MLPTLRYFRLVEFHHPELVNARAALYLDEVRHRYGFPLILTDDARMREDVVPSGGSQTSLHYDGRAFDLRWPGSATRLFHFVECAIEVANEWGERIELELVNGPTDKHVHIGLQRPGTENELIVAAD